jgi:hypothetical protein
VVGRGVTRRGSSRKALFDRAREPAVYEGKGDRDGREPGKMARRQVFVEHERPDREPVTACAMKRGDRSRATDETAAFTRFLLLG